MTDETCDCLACRYYAGNEQANYASEQHQSAIEAEQRREARRREFLWPATEEDYAPLGDPEETPFTEESTSPFYDDCPGCGDCEDRISEDGTTMAEISFPESDIETYRVEVVEPEPASFEPRTFQAVFGEIFGEAFEILVERQKKYGPENIRKLGLYGVFTRIEDKMERLRHAFNGEVVNGVFNIDEQDNAADETLDDADFDAANYHLIRIALRRGVWGYPLEDE